MVFRIKDYIKKCADRVNTIDKAWGTHDATIVNKPTLDINLLLFAISIFLCVVAFSSNNIIYRCFLLYASITFIIVLMYLSVLYKYVFHKPFKNSHIGKILHRLCEAVFVLMIIFEIPPFVLLLIVYWIVGYRAKKIELFMAWVELVLFDLVFVAISLYPIIDFSIWVTKRIIECLRKIGESARESALLFFLIILLLFVIVSIFNTIVLWAIKKRWRRAYENEAQKIIPQIDNGFEVGADIKAFSENKQKKITEQKSIWEDNVKKDIFYIKSSIWKVELLALITIFCVSTFFPNLIIGGKYQGDLINVVTVFTLFILYWDKRALWKELKK